MSETREPWAGTPFEAEYRMLCDGIEREQARADRYQAEFAACKALLIAEQKRAERAEAERAAAEAERADIKKALHVACKAGRQSEEALAAAEQRASEARALALRWRAAVIDFREGACEQGFKCGPYLKPGQHANWLGTFGAENCPMCMGDALAALPVEPARPEQKEIQRDGDTPSAPTRCHHRDCGGGPHKSHMSSHPSPTGDT